MTAGMLNGDDQVVGSLTSGGTESLLMAMKTYRDRAKKLFPHIKNPEMVGSAVFQIIVKLQYIIFTVWMLLNKYQNI